MKLLKNIKYYLLVPLFMAALTSCVFEDTDDPGPLPDDGKIQMEIVTNAAGLFDRPVISRAGSAEESMVNLPWVFVFEHNGSDYIFSEVQQAYFLNSRLYVKLEPRSKISRILIIGNAPDKFTYAGTDYDFTQDRLTSVLANSSFSKAVNDILLTVKLPEVQPSVPYAGNSSTRLPLPVGGEWTLSSIDNTKTIGTPGNKVSLKRALAKVTVTNYASNFEFAGATAVDVPRNGRIHQAAGALLGSAGNKTKYKDASSSGLANIAPAAIGEDGYYSTDDNPIYVYESASADGAKIIIYGQYGGKYYYYPLSFTASDGSTTLIDVKRNYIYQFAIQSMAGRGYDTFDEAAAAPGSNVVKATITVTDESGYEISDNGQYYMALSNSELVSHALEIPQSAPIVALTVTTNAPAGVLGKIAVSGQGLYVASDSFTPSGGATSYATDIEIWYTPAFTEGYLDVTVGNITRRVKISKEEQFDVTAVRETYTGDYVAAEVVDGKDWLSVSFENDPRTGESAITSMTTTGQTVYLFGDKNYYKTSAPRSGNVIFSRSGDKGRVRIYLTQRNVNYISGAYVGTFHRSDQKGERMITIDGTTGSWRATVIEGDFICMDTQMYPGQDQLLMFSAEERIVYVPIEDASVTSVSGTAGPSTPIFFRVALTGTIDSYSVRFGIIKLEYDNLSKVHLIWVRQGEHAVAINGTHPSIAVYNSADTKKALGGSSLSNHTNISSISNQAFSEFPSQSGYFYVWDQGGSYAAGKYAFNPEFPETGSVSGWITNNVSANTASGNTVKVCPYGYRLPNTGDFGDVNNPRVIDYGPDGMIRNAVWGAYADGLYDRIYKNPGKGAEAATDASVVYPHRYYSQINWLYNTGYNMPSFKGYIFFNGGSTTNASVFFPAAGYRSTGGVLYGAGAYGYYGTATYGGLTPESSSFSPKGVYISPAQINGGANVSSIAAVPFRCILNN